MTMGTLRSFEMAVPEESTYQRINASTNQRINPPSARKSTSQQLHNYTINPLNHLCHFPNLAI
jgi:hypothetical protein